jgi:hypothetical protein
MARKEGPSTQSDGLSFHHSFEVASAPELMLLEVVSKMNHISEVGRAQVGARHYIV